MNKFMERITLKPKVENYPYDVDVYSGSEVTNISYDLSTLRITLMFDDKEEPVYIIFKHIVGFRVLDEGELNEFWNVKQRPVGYIWEVKDGGWKSLEELRSGYIGHSKSAKEYLVLGNDDCVSVITYNEPVISDLNIVE